MAHTPVRKTISHLGKYSLNYFGSAGTFKEFIGKLADVLEEDVHGKIVRVCFDYETHHGYYDDTNVDTYLTVAYERDETDEEYEKRVKKEKDARAAGRKAAATTKKKKEEEERALFEKLKSKYGN